MKALSIYLLSVIGTGSGLAFAPMWPGSLNQYQELAAPTNSSAAIAPIFGNSFPKFRVLNPEIVWAAPTNRSRAPLWIYKVVPQSFPAAAISKLMRSGLFTNEITTTTNPLYFANASNTCDLVVQSSQGWIRYWDGFAEANHWDKTKHLNEPVEELPSEAKVEKLGLKLLKQFGIQHADLAQNAKGHLLTYGTMERRSYFDRRRNKYIDEEVMGRGIFFNRRIDGVNFAGIGVGGGCEIMFGNHAKIAKFELVWRNLQPFESGQVASPNEIISYIRNGQAMLTHKNLINPAAVKKLTITDCSPLYMGANGDETQDFVYPFAQVDAVANLGNTNVDIQLYCPILSGK